MNLTNEPEHCNTLFKQSGITILKQVVWFAFKTPEVKIKTCVGFLCNKIFLM